MQLKTLFLAVAAVATAKETCTTKTATGANPPSSTSTTVSANFRIIANTVTSDLTPPVNGSALSSYHLDACLDFAVLEPPTPSGPASGLAFYLNGTAQAVKDEQTTILTDGGTPLTPYGIIVPPANETDAERRRPVRINCGDGTPGVHVSQYQTPTPHVAYHGRLGGWYACNTQLPAGSATVLYYRDFMEKLPSKCVDVVLYTRCVTEVSALAEEARPGLCQP